MKKSKSSGGSRNILGYIKRKMKNEKSQLNIDLENFDPKNSNCSAASLKSVMSALSANKSSQNREKDSRRALQLSQYFDDDKGDFNLAACAFAREEHNSEEFVRSSPRRRNYQENDDTTNFTSALSSAPNRTKNHEGCAFNECILTGDESLEDHNSTLYVDFPHTK
mmetsp:Transcript_4897/g.7128  ORF Transcript_4897/g.7128 Transcript_4897/m.7128 type:complete len:166 (+) Transcript_4897:173-670(+)|eukprot:CAMPEP_0202458638 /NCGR_PEP_ID=MMETSP1360-20130828/26506_1 /ASSEMBLY_ACC=CAM_ASM_000848 /TAXON_ID=515479 /ORGANISM="Licmophora paradoxa, Strain CCMP2313" /LENGTH=165 /DNA_ID=CAMNT_0049079267 /DNA_START=137 /DNA_END=634 /DNA_ORIENTATION=-